MPKRDVEIRLPGIVPREHFVQRSVLSGRAKYPFKSLIIGDYVILRTQQDAILVREALKSFKRRYPARRFTVRQREIGEWICRRVA